MTKALVCRCLAHRLFRPIAYVIVALLNLAHPVLHALGLEGGSLDSMLPILNGLLIEEGSRS